jgi:hypothetical protein
MFQAARSPQALYILPLLSCLHLIFKLAESLLTPASDTNQPHSSEQQGTVLEHLLHKHVRLVQTSRFWRQHKVCNRLENFLPSCRYM